jgi:hypothetical protein
MVAATATPILFDPAKTYNTFITEVDKSNPLAKSPTNFIELPAGSN